MWPNPQKTADLVTFTEEIHNGKFHFLWGAHKQLSLSWKNESVWDDRKSSQDIKASNHFELRDNWQNSCQFHLTEYFLQEAFTRLFKKTICTRFTI